VCSEVRPCFDAWASLEACESVPLVGRPVALEVVKEGVKEGGPVGLEAVHLEVAQREGEAVAKVGISPPHGVSNICD
jgi:hypothetical protein